MKCDRTSMSVPGDTCGMTPSVSLVIRLNRTRVRKALFEILSGVGFRAWRSCLLFLATIASDRHLPKFVTVTFTYHRHSHDIGGTVGNP